MLSNWDALFKKYNVHYENGVLMIGNVEYPQTFVNALEKETTRLFPDVTDENAEVVLCFQLAILNRLKGDK